MKAAFIEQDGVLYPRIETHIAYTSVKFFDGVPESLGKLIGNGYLLAYLNNWPYETGRPIFRMLSNNIARKLGMLSGGGKVFGHCFHSEDENCDCRMPKTALLDKIIKQNKLDPKQCLFFAGSIAGVQAAHSVGIEEIYLMKTGVKYYKSKEIPVIRADDFQDAVNKWNEAGNAAMAC